MSPVVFVILVVVLIPIWVPLLFIAFLIMIAKFILVYAPAFREVQTVPRYWLTWKHVKLITGLSTKETLNFLKIFNDGTFMECRLREEDEVKRICRLLGRKKPPRATSPVLPEQFVFYEYRLIWRGGRRRPSLKGLLNGLFPAKPALQPAYAR